MYWIGTFTNWAKKIANKEAQKGKFVNNSKVLSPTFEYLNASLIIHYVIKRSFFRKNLYSSSLFQLKIFHSIIEIIRNVYYNDKEGFIGGVKLCLR